MQIKCKDYHILPSQARARFVTRCLRHNPSQERMISPAPPRMGSCPSLWLLLPSPSLWPFDVCIAGYREPHQIQRRLSKNYDKPTRHRTNTDSNFANLYTTIPPGRPFPGGEGKGALVSSRHRTCLSMKDRCNHQCFLAFTNLSINELTRSFYSHNMTIQFTSKPTKLMTQKKYLVYKCQTPGRGSAGPECSLLGPLRGSSISHISPWSQPVSNRFLNRAVLAEGFARPPELFS